jgi:hypothetical protein
MNDAKYIGLDVHQATISAAVLDSTGKLVMESVLETKATAMIVNIFFYHLLMDRSGLIIAIVVVMLWGVVAIRHRQYFSGIFVQRPS